MLVFGIGFLVPDRRCRPQLVGILSAPTLSDERGAWTVVAVFIFAAVGTPTGDPITMLAVAGPMWSAL